MMDKLPSGWREVELGEVSIGKGQYGSGASAIEYNSKKPRYVRITDIDDDGILKGEDLRSPSKVEEKYYLEYGDFLFARSGSVGRTYLHDKKEGEYQYAGYLIRFRLDEKLILPKYLYYITQSSFYWIWIENTQKSVTISNINAQQYAGFRFVLPPLPTQKKIVAILEKAERAKEMRKEADALTDEFLRAVFEGMFGHAIMDSKVRKIKMTEILENIDSGWSPVCESFPRENENQKAILKLGAVTYGYFDHLENKCLPSALKIPREVPVEKGDLLFSRKNTLELVGATAYCFKDYNNLFLPDTIFKLRYKPAEVNGIFLWKLLSDIRIRKDMQKLATGSAGSMPNISKSRLLEFEIPLPPYPLQQKFASIVKEVEAMKEKQKHSKEHLDSLFNALMQKAFRGEIA